MKPNIRQFVATSVVLLCGLIGWWIARDFKEATLRHRTSAKTDFSRPSELPQFASHPRPVERDAFRDGATVEVFGSRLQDEVIFRFPTDDAYSSFLLAVGQSRIRVVDQLDRLRAVRLSYSDREDLSLLLLGENITTYASIPSIPKPNPADAAEQQGLVGFGNSLLPWLGINTDHSSWGTGVKVAVLDSGIIPHSDLPGLVQSIEIVPFPKDRKKTHGHGTAVASLIAGVHASAPGIAPAAQLISIRISDDSGQADSFAMAAGILAAVDAGADLINISMGTTTDNPLIEEAVAYAHEHDSLIVASSGNSELAEATYPAAYPSVISVGAVDARGEHLNFSNYGTYLSLTAPGYALNAAWPGDHYTRISGTSASCPLVTGAIAATMSSGNGKTMNAKDAAEIVMNHSDEAGISGPDSEYGVGILNVGRVMTREIMGIVDAAITDQRIIHSSEGDQIEVTVQNRGTTMLVNTLLEVSTPFGNRQFNETTLAPGAIRSFTMPVRLIGMPEGTPIAIDARLTLNSPGQDITPYNNERSDVFYTR